MLELRFVRENMDLVRRKCQARKFDLTQLDRFAEIDGRRLETLAKAEALKNQRNTVSKEIAQMKKAGEHEAAETRIREMKTVSDEIAALDGQLAGIEEELAAVVMAVPNLVDESVPEGEAENDNVEIKRWGEPREFDFTPLNHWDIGEKSGDLDFETAARLSGARFAVVRGQTARLSRALVDFFLDLHITRQGYTEIIPPFLVNSATMTGTGQLPKFSEDLFRIEGRDLWLIPTAEVPLTNLYAGRTVPEEELPIKHTAYTPCFRSEAGSYGKDTRGLIRQHQFEKVEMVKIAAPEQSYAELESMLADAEEILQLLGLPYRVVTLCTADLGFSAAKTYDIEVWLPGQNTYREISSCSNCADFQARRAGIRCKAQGGKTRLAHTLNGSGLPIGRTLVAIMENYQRADGGFDVPKVLEPYMTSRLPEK